MTTPVKERIKIDLEQAQVNGKQRANRIGNILKEAASMTFEEVKEGSAELNFVTKKTLAELLEDWQAVDDLGQEKDDKVVLSVDDGTSAEQPSADPSWRAIIRHALSIVRDRRGDWFQAFKTHLHENAVSADQDLTERYRDRYTTVKKVFQRVVEQIKAQSMTPETAQQADSQPLKVKIVDGDAEAASTPVAVEVLPPEGNR
ncbi:MAG: hypothetical protein AAF609_10245 [Cyanobacteria bacterium P01_C01_bin.120]